MQTATKSYPPLHHMKKLHFLLICSPPCIKKDISIHITTPTNAHKEGVFVNGYT